MLNKNILARALMLVVLGAIVPQAPAQELNIVPIRQNLSSEHRSANFTLTNFSDTPALVQIRAYSWVQKGNDDSFLPTSKLTVSPPFATIAPGKSQTVRLLLRTPVSNGEESYRIIFDQIPDRVGSKVQLTLRFTVPVFSSGSAPAVSNVQWRVEREGENLILVAANRGLGHSMLSNLRATSSNGEPLKLSGPGMPYILAGNERRWVIQDQRHLLNTGSRIHVINPGPQNKSDQWVNIGPNN
ncbi:molecular chaperone [Ewingella sp. S1.OA.A_B6]